MIAYLSNLMIPMVIFGIVILALSTKIDMFAAFTKGAKDGFKVVYEILPTLIGLMLAVGILRTSGILDVVGDILAKPLSVIGFPSQLVPLSLVKMFSSSAATGLLLDIFKKFGTDTYEGLLASILMSCSETIFYTISVYLLATGNNRSRHSSAVTAATAAMATVAAEITTAASAAHPARKEATANAAPQES